MRNIFRFLAKYGTIFLFVLLESVSLYLLFNYNNYQQSAIFSTANKINGYAFSVKDQVTGYLNLRHNNDVLFEENNRLQMEVAHLKSALGRLTDTTRIAMYRVQAADEFSLIPAKVIHSTVSHLRNYITLNVGSKDGIKPEMGVANSEGIVGVISLVSENYAIAIPVLNKDQRFSCKIKQNKALGSLVWDGVDSRYAYLEEIPPYVQVKKGDTIVTSGFSAIFPEGVMVGRVVDYGSSTDANYLRLKVALSTRFNALSNVRIIRYTHKQERIELENKATQ